MEYEGSWDCPHAPGPEEHWQESDCYWFLDVAQGVGGFHRIGQTPNTDQAHIMLFAFALGGERYLNTRPVSSGDVERGAMFQRVETHRAESLGDQRMRYAWAEANCSADLEFYESFYTPRDWHSGARTEVDMQMNSGGHLECGGRIRGTLRIGSRSYTVDALAHRDRSWGPREWKVTGQSKMFSGTIGRELSWATYAFQQRESGDWVEQGFVARDGVIEQVSRVRVIAAYDNDSYTALSGEGQLTLQSGEVVRIPCTPVQAFVTKMADFAAVDNLSLVEIHGKTGFVDLEVLLNPGRGPFHKLPEQKDVSFACVDPGLSASAHYS